jgi:putative addiction module component (TIGR02574 family)
MIALDEIRKMPLHEKLLVMEAIWDEISREQEKLDVPQWHKDLLDERERLIAEGKAKFIDWEDAKKQIKEATEGGFKYSTLPRTT